MLNIFSVRYFGVTEFYFSIGKVVLVIGLFFFTFITMVGGNPLHDAYGFRFWKDPGPFIERFEPGDLGKFLGVLSCLYQASFSYVELNSLGETLGLTLLIGSPAQSISPWWQPRPATLARFCLPLLGHSHGDCSCSS
jgi:amino acid permease